MIVAYETDARDGAVKPSCNYFILVSPTQCCKKQIPDVLSIASQIKVIVFSFVFGHLPNVSVYISVRGVKVRSNWGGGRGVGVRKERGRVLR